MVKMVLHAFGDLDLDSWSKLLAKAYPSYKFGIGKKIPTSAEFRVGTIVERKPKKKKIATPKSRVPTFSANLILQYLNNDKNKDIHLVLTKHLLVVDKSITSTLYAGLCWTEKQLMIVSFARLDDDKVIATVIHHEIGHMLGLPHCEDDKCIMREGQHGVDVVASTFWCEQCTNTLKK